MNSYIGKKLEGRYEIRELIGVGGMANVYKAYDLVENRVVAVKILREEFAENEEFIKRFKIESKAISVLAHPNIVRVYDVTFTDRIQSIVMEYVDGITLKEYIEQQKVLKWKEAVHFTVQILRALQHAHDKGIIHRDIKPQNIMLQADGTIKVMDFGIARFNHTEQTTGVGKVIGSVHYISPEQARGEITDEKTDVYSVGVMLFEMLTGSLPFEAADPVSVAMKQIADKPKMPRELNPSIPEGLEDITIRAMQKDVALRYQSAAEMLRDMESFKQNPHIQFEYKYFSNESPTKFMDAIDKGKQHEPLVEDYNEPPKKKKKAPVLLILGAIASVLLVALLVAVIFMFQGFGGDDIPVPNLVGKEYAEIKLEEQFKNITFKEKTEFSSDYEAGIIMKQDPPYMENRTMKAAGVITVWISRGPKEQKIPDNIFRIDVDTVISILQSKGFTDIDVQFNKKNNPDIEDNVVTDTDPAIGEMAAVDKTITLYVNPSLKDVPVPNVKDMSFEEAKKILEGKGFKVESEYKASTVIKDRVLAQSATTAKQGSTITLTLSSGQAEVKTIKVTVPLPKVSQPLTFRAFIDGMEITGLPNYPLHCYPAEKEIWDVPVKGTEGSKRLVIRIDEGQNQVVYARYLIDFDKNEITQIALNPYPPKEESNVPTPETPSEAPSETPPEDASKPSVPSILG